MDRTTRAVSLLQQHWSESARITRLVTRGLSDSLVCKVSWSGESYCLKGAKNYSRARLQWIHRLRQTATDVGLAWLPAAVPTRAGATCVVDDGSCWELTPWLPGEPTTTPSLEQCRAGVQALAEVHVAWNRHTDSRKIPGGSRAAIPLAVEQRKRFAVKMLAIAEQVDWSQFAGREMDYPWAKDVGNFVAQSTYQIPGLLRQLEMWDAPVPIQPVFRDIWSDHLLLENDQVSGFIDLHAADWGTVAGDLGRLLASWSLPVGWEDWHELLELYHSVRPLGEAERRLVRLLDDAARILTPWVWLHWIHVEKRSFPTEKLNQRLGWALARFFACEPRGPIGS